MLGPYRGRRARPNSGVRTAVKYAKLAFKLKKEYDKRKKAAPKKKAPPRKRPARKRPNVKSGPRSIPIARLSDSYTNLYEKTTAAHRRQYPQILAQKYYVTSPESYVPFSTTDGTITNPDMLYSPSSLSWENASIMMFNISNTEAHWVPVTALPVQGYRTGTQLVGTVAGSPGDLTADNASFIWENNALSTTLQSRRSPFSQSGLAENAIGANANYTTPNSLLTGVSWNLKVCNPTIQAQMLSVKLVRYNDGADGVIKPGTFGDTATETGALINTMCNARAWTDPQQFSTIYSKTYRISGLRPGTRLRMTDISHKCSMSYLRTQFRKQYNANSMATLGTQAKPTYQVTDDGKMFNSCFLVVSSTCVDDQYIADAQVATNTAAGAPDYFERMPQLATYPPVGIPTTELSGKFKAVAVGAQFGISGTVSVFHRVQAIRRAISSTTAAAISDLQAQLDSLTLFKSCKEKDKEEVLDRDSLSSPHSSSGESSPKSKRT